MVTKTDHKRKVFFPSYKLKATVGDIYILNNLDGCKTRVTYLYLRFELHTASLNFVTYKIGYFTERVTAVLASWK